MPNTLTGWNTFVAQTKIESAKVNSNLSALKNGAATWQKYTVPYTSFSALGATATGAVTLWSSTAAEVMTGWLVKHSTLFTGTSITAAVCRVGKTGADGQYTNDFDVKQAVASGAAQLTSALDCEFSTTSILVTLSLTGGLLNQLSQGSVDVYVLKNDLP